MADLIYLRFSQFFLLNRLHMYEASDHRGTPGAEWLLLTKKIDLSPEQVKVLEADLERKRLRGITSWKGFAI